MPRAATSVGATSVHLVHDQATFCVKRSPFWRLPRSSRRLSLFYLQIPLKRKSLNVRVGGFGSSRLYPQTSSMPSAACLPMEGIQCEHLSRVSCMEA
jgi:hypothetical protein